MAEEAAVENLPVNRFFCHKCSREVHAELPDYICPCCQSGFIEALDNAPEPSDEADPELDMDMHQPFEELINEMLIDAGIRNEERRGGRRRSARRTLENQSEERRNLLVPVIRRNRRTRAARNRQLAPMEHLIQDFIMHMTGFGGSNTIGVGTARTGTPGGHLLLMANPGDYAWGREGLDAIVTQLLNQMDTTGPPPLAKDKISQIPVVIITKEQQDTNIQCSVCWEDFKAEESVRKLPCDHLYHENCIIPWLELHGTCPICRKTLTDDGRAEDPDNSTNVSSLASLFRYTPSESSNSRTSSSSSSSSSSGSGTRSWAPSSTRGSTGGSTSSSTNSSRPDFNMELDFD